MVCDHAYNVIVCMIAYHTDFDFIIFGRLSWLIGFLSKIDLYQDLQVTITKVMTVLIKQFFACIISNECITHLLSHPHDVNQSDQCASATSHLQRSRPTLVWVDPSPRT